MHYAAIKLITIFYNIRSSGCAEIFIRVSHCSLGHSSSVLRLKQKHRWMQLYYSEWDYKSENSNRTAKTIVCVHREGLIFFAPLLRISILMRFTVRDVTVSHFINNINELGTARAQNESNVLMFCGFTRSITSVFTQWLVKFSHFFQHLEWRNYLSWDDELTIELTTLNILNQ